MSSLRSSLQGRASLGALTALGSAFAQGGGVSPRTSTLRVATFGDSTSDFSSKSTTNTTAWDEAFSSGTTQITRRQEKLLTAALYGQTFMVGNGGIGGQRTQQMLDRSLAASSATRKAMEDIIALAPDVVLLRGGSINDLTFFTPPITQQNINDMVARHKTIIDTFANAGIWVISAGIYGYSAATNTAQVQAAIVNFNAQIAAYSRSRFRFIDINGITHDGTGAFKSGISADGTHLQNKGGYLVAQMEAAVLRSIFGVSSGLRYAGVNVIPNADLLATTTNAIGTVGNGWAVGATNLTRANCKVETINGVLMQTGEFTPTADGAIGSIAVPFGVSGGSPTIPLVVGDVYGVEVDIYLAGLAGAPPPAGQFFSRLSLFQTGNVIRNIYGPVEPAFGDAYPEAIQLHANLEPITIQAASANLTTSSDLKVNFTMGTAGDRTPFKLGFNARMVKLN